MIFLPFFILHILDTSTIQRYRQVCDEALALSRYPCDTLDSR